MKGMAHFRLCLLLAAAVTAAALFGSALYPADPYAQDLAASLLPPDGAHPLGTDRYGRDLLARVLAGGRTTLLSTLCAVGLSASLGAALGAACGWLGGWFDGLAMRLADLALSFPSLALAMAVAAALPGGTEAAVLALALVSWPKYARLARSRTMAIRGSDFLLAALLAGAGTARLLRRHVLPHVAGPVIIAAAQDVGTMMTEIAALSFLGLGAAPPAAEWGSMLSEGRSLLQLAPWVVIGPGAAMAAAVVVWNLLGDAARDRLSAERSGR